MDIHQHSTGIPVRSNESIESALKRFKRDCANAGILSELKRREYYEKPSSVKRKKNEAAKRKKDKKRLLFARKSQF